MLCSGLEFKMLPSPTLLVIWAIVILMLSWLRSPKCLLLVGLLLLDGFQRHLFWFHTFDGVFGRFDLAAMRGCHTLNVCLFAKYTKQADWYNLSQSTTNQSTGCSAIQVHDCFWPVAAAMTFALCFGNMYQVASSSLPHLTLSPNEHRVSACLENSSCSAGLTQQRRCPWAGVWLQHLK
jgi:hypothetical protein